MGPSPVFKLKLLIPHVPTRYHADAVTEYNVGHRSCIGRKFAETEMKCLLATFVHKFKFESVSGRIVEKEVSITVRPKGGLPLRIKKLRT